jgi:hypothetical protein
VAYLALWDARAAAGRVVAVDAGSGAVLGAQDVRGVPGDVAVAPAPGGAGVRLYCVVAAPAAGGAAGPDADGARSSPDRSWRLLGLHAVTLEPESEVTLPWPAHGLAVAPDGRDAYAYAGPGSLLWGSVLLRVDLVAGAAAPLGPVPGSGIGGLAVTADRVYVPDSGGDTVWVADRRGRPLPALPTGRRPLAVAAGAGPA